MTIPYFAMDLEYTCMLMLGTVDILDDDNGTDTTATTTDADHVFMSFKIACMYVYMY
jgi:hypothetical protein